MNSKILVVKPSSLGDIVHTLPSVAAIKQSNENCYIAWVVFDHYAEILRDNPYIDRVFTLQRQNWRGVSSFLRRRAAIWRELLPIREESFDIAIDFQGLFRSALIALVSGCSRRIGFANARELAPWSYTEKVIVPNPTMHAVDRYKLLVQHLGISEIANVFPISLDEKHHQAARDWLPSLPIVTIAPGARWNTKRWAAENFAMVADRLTAEMGASIALVGSREDREIAEKIRCCANNGERFVDLTGKTSLRELAAVLERSQVVLTNDSGPMHIAVAMNTPTLGIFGPTDPNKVGPYGEMHWVIRKNLCAPGCRRTCAYATRCLTAITVEEVVQKVALLLQSQMSETV